MTSGEDSSQRDAIASQPPLPRVAYERLWKLLFMDREGRTRKRTIISTVTETADEVRGHAEAVHHRWSVVSVRVGEILPC
jgi:hypothetical protein